jgi:hypothetical protein
MPPADRLLRWNVCAQGRVALHGAGGSSWGLLSNVMPCNDRPSSQFPTGIKTKRFGPEDRQPVGHDGARSGSALVRAAAACQPRFLGMRVTSSFFRYHCANSILGCRYRQDVNRPAGDSGPHGLPAALLRLSSSHAPSRETRFASPVAACGVCGASYEPALHYMHRRAYRRPASLTPGGRMSNLGG